MHTQWLSIHKKLIEFISEGIQGDTQNLKDSENHLKHLKDNIRTPPKNFSLVIVLTITRVNTYIKRAEYDDEEFFASPETNPLERLNICYESLLHPGFHLEIFVWGGTGEVDSIVSL